MTVCEACEGEITEEDTYCRHCGASLSGSTVVLTKKDSENNARQENEPVVVDDPQSQPGFFEAFVPYFLPGSSNELEMKRRLGGCPACGEGRELDFKNSSATRSVMADVTGSDIKCTRCDTVLESSGFAFNVVEGDPELVDEELTQSECKNLAAARRKGDTDRVQELLADIKNEEEDGWSPRHPVLSVFASVMLLWAGFWALGSSGSPTFDFLLFTTLAVLIIPRVRKSVIKIIGKKTDRDLTSQISRIVIGAIYSLMVFAAALLMIGEATQDPATSAGSGFMAIVFVFVLAVLVVYAIRICQRFSGS